MSTHPVISKISKGSSFAGALRYDLGKESGELLDTNCASREADSIATEMDTVAASNPRSSKPVFHVSLSLEQGQKVTPEQWRRAAEIYREKMDFGERQFALTHHIDTAHDHCHLVINRVSADGKGWSDGQDRRRSAQACRAIEQELCIKPTLTQQPGRFDQVKADLREATAEVRGRGLAGLRESMAARGYELVENRSQSSGRISGVSIKCRSDGKTWKASELQRGGWRTIEKQLTERQRMPGAPRKAAQRVIGGLVRPVRVPRPLRSLNSTAAREDAEHEKSIGLHNQFLDDAAAKAAENEYYAQKRVAENEM